MWIVVSDEIEVKVRNLAKKKGDISKLFEEAMRMYFKARDKARDIEVCPRCKSSSNISWTDEEHSKRQYKCMHCNFKWEGG